MVLDSAGTQDGGRVGYDAQHDEPAVIGSVYLSREAGDETTTAYVRGALRVVKHPGVGTAGSSAGSWSVG